MSSLKRATNVKNTRWLWFASAFIAAVGCLFFLFVLFVALRFDEVSEGPRSGTRVIVTILALGSAAAAGVLARRGRSEIAAPEAS